MPRAAMATAEPNPDLPMMPPDEFDAYATTARAKGFLMVSATPLTRSSHHADDDFEKLKAARSSNSR